MNIHLGDIGYNKDSSSTVSLGAAVEIGNVISDG